MNNSIFSTEETILSSIKKKILKRGLYFAEDHVQYYLKFLLNFYFSQSDIISEG